MSDLSRAMDAAVRAAGRERQFLTDPREHHVVRLVDAALRAMAYDLRDRGVDPAVIDASVRAVAHGMFTGETAEEQEWRRGLARLPPHAPTPDALRSPHTEPAEGHDR